MTQLLTAQEVASQLGLSRAHVYAVKYKIGYVKLGRVIRFRREAVERFIQTNERDTPTAIRAIDIPSD